MRFLSFLLLLPLSSLTSGVLNRKSKLSTLSSTSIHLPFRRLRSQLYTSAKVSDCGSSQPGIPASHASLRISASNRAALLAWTQNVILLVTCCGEGSKTRWRAATCCRSSTSCLFSELFDDVMYSRVVRTAMQDILR